MCQAAGLTFECVRSRATSAEAIHAVGTLMRNNNCERFDHALEFSTLATLPEDLRKLMLAHALERSTSSRLRDDKAGKDTIACTNDVLPAKPFKCTTCACAFRSKKAHRRHMKLPHCKQCGLLVLRRTAMGSAVRACLCGQEDYVPKWILERERKAKEWAERRAKKEEAEREQLILCKKRLSG